MPRNGNKATQWPKGVSGNPKGLPKGYKQVGPILTKILNQTITIEQGIDEMGKNKTKKKMTLQEAMLYRLVTDSITKAKNGDGPTASERTKAAQTIMDRIEGKAVQPLSTPETTPTIPPIIQIIGVVGTETPGE